MRPLTWTRREPPLAPAAVAGGADPRAAAVRRLREDAELRVASGPEWTLVVGADLPWADGAKWADTVDDLWLLGSPRLTAPRCLTTTESAWDEKGATAVRVELNGLATELTLPGRRHGVRLLRGNLRTPPAQPRRGTALRFPSFPGAERVLLARGGTDRELVTLRVRSGIQQAHTLPGRLLAAAQVHKRLVTLVERDGVVRPHVIGNRLRYLSRIEANADELGIDPERVADTGLAPLHLHEGTVLCRWDEKSNWWCLEPGSPPHLTEFAAVAPGAHHEDTPRTSETPDVFGPAPLVAKWRDWRRWRVANQDVELPAKARPLGLHLFEDRRPGIVFQEGLVLRVRTAAGTRTLTAWSGAPAAVHPAQPWVAIQRDDGRIEVGDLVTGKRIATMRGDG